jgi:hypothetical protein
MRPLPLLLIVLVCATSSLPVTAITKCTLPDGKVVFQDTACAGRSELLDVKPAGGRGVQAPPGPAPASATAAASAPAKPKTESQRLEGLIADSQRNRRKQDLRDMVLPLAEAELNGHRASCEQKQQSLAASQYAYKQNLFGKTHAAQMASEMAAAAAVCDTKDRQLKEKVDALVAECATLGCR